MKVWLLILLVWLCIFTGCRQKPVEPKLLGSLKTYRDIPGVTKEEISAVEALKAAKGSFSYGTLFSTEFFMLPDGSYAGFAKDFCDNLTNLFGVNFEPKLYEWDELMSALDSKTLDFSGELTPTAERAERYVMSYPIAERMLRLFTHRDSKKINVEADINGLRIGFLEDTIIEDSIRRAYPSLSFNSVSVVSYAQAAQMIARGELDGFVDEAVSDPDFAGYDFINSMIFFSMVHEPIAMTTGDFELNPIISVLNKYLLAGGFDRQDTLYRDGEFKYTKYKLRELFTDEEKAYIDNLKQSGASVSIAFENDNYPVSFYNKKEKQFQGIVVDVLRDISRLTDLQFESAVEPNATWAEIYIKTQSGTIQMVSQLLYSESRKDLFLWSAVPYAHSYYAIMSKASYPNLASYQISRKRVGVLEKSAHEDRFYELFPGSRNLIKYGTREASLNALEKGDVDLLMASEYILLTQIHYREKPDFKINLRLSVPLDSYFGFHKGEEILCSIIDKAQPYVQTDIIEIGWTGRVFDYSKKLAEDRAVFLMGFVSILLVLLVVSIFLLLKNRRLARKLAEIASHDVLTGILNRRYFMELGVNQIDRSLRLGKESFMIIFDLDHFKLVNDTYGHQAGDMVLKEVARRVKKSVRPYDLFGRYGGEEFILLLFDIARENVLTVAERIRQDICKVPVDFEGTDIAVAVSIGIAYAAPKNHMDAAIRHADTALYQAKETGRNRAVFYEHVPHIDDL